VTIVGGFRFARGIVLLADTQETVGISKRHVPKLRFEQTPLTAQALNRSDLAIAFCGATNNGAFVDKLVDLAWKAAHLRPNLDSVCAAIEKSIEETYRHYGTIYQSGFLPDAELIYGATMHGRSRMFSALGPIVNEKEEYCTGGIGAYMADFLASRMYGEELTVQQCVILAAYILFQAKEHVDGCGGNSHIAVLREDGPSGLVDARRIEAITLNLQRADAELGGFLLASSDIDIADKDFRQRADSVFRSLKMYRESQRKDLEGWHELWEHFDAVYGVTVERDSFGLTVAIDRTEQDQAEEHGSYEEEK
jgi:20S proteasome alpha/beta subunit